MGRLPLNRLANRPIILRSSAYFEFHSLNSTLAKKYSSGFNSFYNNAEIIIRKNNTNSDFVSVFVLFPCGGALVT